MSTRTRTESAPAASFLVRFVEGFTSRAVPLCR